MKRPKVTTQKEKAFMAWEYTVKAKALFLLALAKNAGGEYGATERTPEEVALRDLFLEGIDKVQACISTLVGDIIEQEAETSYLEYLTSTIRKEAEQE